MHLRLLSAKWQVIMFIWSVDTKVFFTENILESAVCKMTGADIPIISRLGQQYWSQRFITTAHDMWSFFDESTDFFQCCAQSGIWKKDEAASLNSLRPRQNGCHFADNTFKHIFLNENVCISIEISLKFVLKGPMNNMAAMVQIMAWRRPGDKPLCEPMMVSLPMHICFTQPQWVNSLAPGGRGSNFIRVIFEHLVWIRVMSS